MWGKGASDTTLISLISSKIVCGCLSCTCLNCSLPASTSFQFQWQEHYQRDSSFSVRFFPADKMVEHQQCSQLKSSQLFKSSTPHPRLICAVQQTPCVSYLQTQFQSCSVPHLYPLRTEKRYTSIFNKQQQPEIGTSCLALDKATAVKPQLKPQREND